LTEFILLGNIAMQHSPDELKWDGRNARVTNNEAANKHIQRRYRNGWKILGA